MLVSEFINRTGYTPDAAEYDDIQEAYYHFDGDKDQFCRAWSRANPHKAGTLWRKLKEQERLARVFDKLVYHVTHRPCTSSYSSSLLYMDYEQRQAHADHLQDYAKAKSRRELRDMLEKIRTSYGITRDWSSERWRYLRELISIV